MGEKIIAIRKDHNGDIAFIKTNQGKVLSIQEAQHLAKEEYFDSIQSLDKEGNWIILNSAGTAERIEGHNLDKLPEF